MGIATFTSLLWGLEPQGGNKQWEDGSLYLCRARWGNRTRWRGPVVSNQGEATACSSSRVSQRTGVIPLHRIFIESTFLPLHNPLKRQGEASTMLRYLDGRNLTLVSKAEGHSSLLSPPTHPLSVCQTPPTAGGLWYSCNSSVSQMSLCPEDWGRSSWHKVENEGVHS